MAATVDYSWSYLREIDLDSTFSASEVTSLANGGFAGIGNNGGLTNGTIFNSHGVLIDGWAGSVGVNGALDQLSDGNLVIVGQDGNSTLFKVVSSLTGDDVVATIDIGNTGSGDVDVTALAGGGFWIVNRIALAGPGPVMYAVQVHIRNNDGSKTGIANPDFIITFGSDNSPSVAALDGGNLAVAWSTVDGHVLYAVYSAKGDLISDIVPIGLAPGIGNVSITAMDGGGFALAFQDTRWNNDGDVTLARFSATGIPLGVTDVSQNASAEGNPSLTRLSNGMLAVGMQTMAGASDTSISLVDSHTGAVLATRTITAGQSISDEAIDLSATGFGLGQLAVLHTNLTDNDVQGEALQGVRTSIGDGSADTINGDDFVDVIFGNDGADTLFGFANNDALVGGAGGDTAYGGGGNDHLLMDDFINPSALGGADTGYGEAGIDLLWGYGGNDTLFGGAENDTLVGNDYSSNVTGLDALYGGAGADTLFVGLGGNAYLDGGAGNDTLYGGAISDTLRGGAGSDFLYGKIGADHVQFYHADFSNGDADIVYFVDPGDRLQFSSSMNGSLFFQNLASLEYAPGQFTTGVYITAFLGGGQTATITVYGTTVASLTPMVEYTL